MGPNTVRTISSTPRRVEARVGDAVAARVAVMDPSRPPSRVHRDTLTRGVLAGHPRRPRGSITWWHGQSIRGPRVLDVAAREALAGTGRAGGWRQPARAGPAPRRG